MAVAVVVVVVAASEIGRGFSPDNKPHPKWALAPETCSPTPSPRFLRKRRILGDRLSLITQAIQRDYPTNVG